MFASVQLAPMSHFFVPSRGALAAILVLNTAALAQTPAPAPSAPSPHAVVLDEYIASASPFRRNQIDVAQSTTILSDRSLLLKQQSTLGETLAGELGVSATSFGPGASRPIIRGLGGDRIRLLENSVGTLDGSVTSPDHAVSVEPFLVERIEVVRGPASLLFGSTAVGGLVNVITHRIETEVPTERVRGGAELRYGSAAQEFSRGGVLDLSLLPAGGPALVLHLDAFRRSTGDLRIPGFAESVRLRTEEAAESLAAGEAPEAAARGYLPNSSLDAESGAVGLSLVGPEFHLGASYTGFNTRYGIPGHAHESEEPTEVGSAPPGPEAPGVRIDLRQRRTAIDGEWRRATGFVNGLRLKFGHANYRHQEIEPDGNIGTVFTNQGYDARLELLHGGAPGWSGALGAQSTRSRLAAIGEEAFLPPSLTRVTSLFAFEEIARSSLTWQFGARFDRTQLEPESMADHCDDELSGSLGAVWKIDPVHSLALSVAHTGRSPNAQELFADGPHAGTQAYEIGDRNLRAERSLGLELSLRRQTGFVTGSVAVFTNRFQGYVFEQPSGLLAIEPAGAWEFVAPDSAAALAAGGSLPVFQYLQRNAHFWGAEIETLWHLHSSSGSQLDLKVAADFTRAREDGGNLPRIPAARTIAGLSWANGPWNAGVESQFVFEQSRVGPNERPTAGYTLVSADLSWTHLAGRYTYEVFAHGANLANQEVRPHPSFLKDLAPLAGRAVTAGVRLRF